MSTKKWFLLALVAMMAISLIGCGTAPTPTPAATPPPQVVTVVITPTPPPPTATLAQPAITPLPTVALTTTVPTATPTTVVVKATNTPGAPKPAATKTPTKAAAVATATETALSMKFGAPLPMMPLWQPPWNEGQKDEVKFPGSAMVYRWKPVGGLNGDECYLLTATSEAVNNPTLPTRTDTFVVGCGDSTPVDVQNGFTFTLYQPGRGGPSYSSLMMDSSEMWVYWTVTIVKNLGSCVDQYHCKTAPISPASYRGKFLFKGS